jgi:dienelactone hydrolase
MEKRSIDYRCDGVTLEGVAVLPEGKGKVPGVLVSHDWTGRNAFAEQRAADLAALGYVGFALDMYGEGKTGATVPEKAQLMTPLREDRSLLMRRMQAALAALKDLDRVDASKTGAIGFCFGGLCALDLARSGAELSAVVSFHGLLDAPPKALCKPISARVLALHGYRDPMATPEQLVAFGKEMVEANCDWQLHAYGTAVHAFTNPEANDPGFGTVYDERVAKRAFRSMRDFLGDVFG